jgi:hypothetical protein
VAIGSSPRSEVLVAPFVDGLTTYLPIDELSHGHALAKEGRVIHADAEGSEIVDEGCSVESVRDAFLLVSLRLLEGLNGAARVP